MKFVIQRVNHASVRVDGTTVGAIEKGLLVLIGVGKQDTKEIADKYLQKLIGLRIFEDMDGKTRKLKFSSDSLASEFQNWFKKQAYKRFSHSMDE